MNQQAHEGGNEGMERTPPPWAPLGREYGWGDENGGWRRAKPAPTGGVKAPRSVTEGVSSRRARHWEYSCEQNQAASLPSGGAYLAPKSSCEYVFVCGGVRARAPACSGKGGGESHLS